jgi:hypothetical protein
MGAVAIHLIALALLLPLLITLPGPGSEIPPKPVNIEVDIGSPAKSQPIVPDVSSLSPAAGEQTSALPAESESSGETPDALARVSPDSEPAAEQEQETVPEKSEPAVGAPEHKAKPLKAQAKEPAKIVKPAPKVARTTPQRKPLLARGKSSKLFLGGRTASSNVQGASWGALLNAPH